MPRLRLPQLEFSTPTDDFPPEVDEGLDQLEQGHDLRSPPDNGEHDDPEAQLQLCVLVKVVQHHLWHLTALQLDDDAHAVPVRFVAEV